MEEIRVSQVMRVPQFLFIQMGYYQWVVTNGLRYIWGNLHVGKYGHNKKDNNGEFWGHDQTGLP